MASKRKIEPTVPKSDLSKRIRYYLDNNKASNSSSSATKITPENIVDEVLNSPQIVSKV